jgi:hypothetical protein
MTPCATAMRVRVTVRCPGVRFGDLRSGPYRSDCTVAISPYYCPPRCDKMASIFIQAHIRRGLVITDAHDNDSLWAGSGSGVCRRTRGKAQVNLSEIFASIARVAGRRCACRCLPVLARLRYLAFRRHLPARSRPRLLSPSSPACCSSLLHIARALLQPFEPPQISP